MLKEIYVKNFVLMDEVLLPFDADFSVFTGETGAGKSLLIDAIALLCGARSKEGLVKYGKDKAILEAVVDCTNHPIAIQLENDGYEIEEGTFHVTREIMADGKSTARINRRAVSISYLREIMNQLIDIHCQHDSQYLLNKNSHLHLLDEYMHEYSQAEKVMKLWKAYDELVKQKEKLLNEDLNEDDLDYLKFQVNEIEACDVDEIKEREAIDEEKKMASFEKLSAHINSALELLDGHNGTMETLYSAVHELEGFDFSEITQAHDTLYDCYYQVMDVKEKLSDYQNSMEFDEERFNEIQIYLFQLNKLKRKYGSSVKMILEKKEEMVKRIEWIENSQQILDQLDHDIQTAYQKYVKEAQILSEKRRKSALKLEKQILQELKDLYLEHARFKVDFTSFEGNQRGIDKVEFLISMNPGEKLRPLADVASGGELSRLMLGLKTIFSYLSLKQTVIFDEIDTGVSGKVALAIGKKMHQIASTSQVFSITHLAAVAACADHHFVVEKKQSKDSTHTNIRELDENQRLEEMALIASNSVSEHALNAARELRIKAINN